MKLAVSGFAEYFVDMLVPLALHILSLNIAEMIAGRFFRAEYTSAFLAVFAALICLPFLLILRRYQQSRRRSGRDCSGTGEKNAGSPAWLFAAACAGMGLAFLLERMIRSTGLADSRVNGTLQELHAAPMYLKLIGLCLIVPIAEEIIYREMVYGNLVLALRRKKIRPPRREYDPFQGILPSVPENTPSRENAFPDSAFWISAIVSALVFAAGHDGTGRFLYAFLMGLALAVFYEKSGLAACVCFHIGANLISVLMG